MKFYITSTMYGKYHNKMLEVYPFLKDFGFDIEEKIYPKIYRVKDEHGNYMTQEDFVTIGEPVVEINTLEELLELIRLTDEEMVVNNDPPMIEIYDSYRE